MRLTTGILVASLASVSFSLLSCDALKIVDVTLDVAGNSLCLFTGYYETTTKGQTQITGYPPKSYTFEARKKYDVVAAQILRVGAGELTAKIVVDGTTRCSAATSGVIDTLKLTWVAK
jgi:hypothetical protein